MLAAICLVGLRPDGHREVLHCVHLKMLGLVQRLLDLQIAFTIQIDGLHISKAIWAIRHSQQQQVSRKKGILDNLQHVSNLQAIISWVR